MPTTKEHKPGAPCPQCGGAFTVDEAQDPAPLIERNKRNAANPAAAARFAEAVLEKASEHGLIHRCTQCGYRARFAPKGKAA